MPLSDDHRAMLQLVLERGQSYEDLASVLGVGVDEVRRRARTALTELGGTDPDAAVGLTDYLLGQADPIGRADAVRELQSNPELRRLASELVERLRELAPDARLPELPALRERRGVLGKRRQGPAGEAGGAAPTEAAPHDTTGAARLRDTFSRRQQQAIVAVAASAVILIAVVLALTGAFGGGEEPVSNETTTAAGDDVLETVPLRPRSGGDGSGEARFGLATEDQPFVELELQGLDAPADGETYVVWLLLSPNQGYPLSPVQIGDDGGFSDRFAIPQFAIPIATRARFVDISLSQNRSLLSDLRDAVRDERPILRYQGDTVLRGEIPVSARQGGGGGGGQGEGGGQP